MGYISSDMSAGAGFAKIFLSSPPPGFLYVQTEGLHFALNGIKQVYIFCFPIHDSWKPHLQYGAIEDTEQTLKFIPFYSATL